MAPAGRQLYEKSPRKCIPEKPIKRAILDAEKDV
jgi:hypothetical protein